MSEVLVRPSETPFADTDKNHCLMEQAILDALRQHKQAGNPIAVWEDGKVKIIQPEDIVLPEEALS